MDSGLGKVEEDGQRPAGLASGDRRRAQAGVEASKAAARRQYAALSPQEAAAALPIQDG